MEQTFTFGPEGNLVGTLTLPDGASTATSAILLTNVGLMPRCGPYRVNVELARRLARRGLACLRFDLSGIGDSDRSSDPLPVRDQWVMDTCAAMNELQRRLGVRGFIMIGICSGADVALFTASSDNRLHSVAIFDPYLYPTRRSGLWGAWHRLHFLGFSATIRRALGRMRRRMQALSTRQQVGEADLDDTMRYGPGVPSLDEFAGRIGMILDHGGKVLLLHSGSYPYVHNYAGQTADNLRPYGLHDKVQSDYFPFADHVLMGVEGREAFLDRCERFAMEALKERDAADGVQAYAR